jgi:hypothetical protein
MTSLTFASISSPRLAKNKGWMEAFMKAAKRWESIITGDLPGTVESAQVKNCKGYPTTIDDVYICVYDIWIDGAPEDGSDTEAVVQISSKQEARAISTPNWKRISSHLCGIRRT